MTTHRGMLVSLIFLVAVWCAPSVVFGKIVKDTAVLAGSPNTTTIDGAAMTATFGFSLSFPSAYLFPFMLPAQGMMFDGSGDLWVSDTAAGLVRKVKTSGDNSVTTLHGMLSENVLRNFAYFFLNANLWASAWEQQQGKKRSTEESTEGSATSPIDEILAKFKADSNMKITDEEIAKLKEQFGSKNFAKFPQWERPQSKEKRDNEKRCERKEARNQDYFPCQNINAPHSIIKTTDGHIWIGDAICGIWKIDKDSGELERYYGYPGTVAMAYDSTCDKLYVGNYMAQIGLLDRSCADINGFRSFNELQSAGPISDYSEEKFGFVNNMRIVGTTLYASIQYRRMHPGNPPNSQDFAIGTDVKSWLVKVDLTKDGDEDYEVGEWTATDFHIGAFDLKDVSGTLYIYYSEYGFGQITVAELGCASGTLTLSNSVTYGSATEWKIKDGAAASVARFYYPTAMQINSGVLYFIDGYQLRKMDLTSKVVTTIAGDHPYLKDGQGTNARMGFGIATTYGAPHNPITAGPDGTLYLAENYFGAIREVNKTGYVRTVYESSNKYPSWYSRSAYFSLGVKRSLPTEHNDKSKRTNIPIPSDSAFGPTSLAIHPTNGNIYFVDNGQFLKVYKRASNSVEMLIDTPYSSFGGICFHPARPNSLFYTDAFSGIYEFFLNNQTSRTVLLVDPDNNDITDNNGFVSLSAGGYNSDGHPRLFSGFLYGSPTIVAIDIITGAPSQFGDQSEEYPRSLSYNAERDELYYLDLDSENVYGYVMRARVCPKDKDIISVDYIAGDSVDPPSQDKRAAITAAIGMTIGLAALILRKRHSTRMTATGGCCMPPGVACCGGGFGGDMFGYFFAIFVTFTPLWYMMSSGGPADKALFLMPSGLVTTLSGIYVATVDNVIINIPYPIETNITAAYGILPTTGGTITIEGANFGTDPNTNVYVYKNIICSASIITDTKIVCDVGPGAGKHLGVSVGDSCPAGFINYAPPYVTSAYPSPPSVMGGTVVTITGGNFGPDISKVKRVTITGLECTNVFMVTPHTTIACTTPVGVGSLNPVIVYIGPDMDRAQESNGNITLPYPRAYASAPPGEQKLYFVRSTHGEGTIAIFGDFFPNHNKIVPTGAPPEKKRSILDSDLADLVDSLESGSGSRSKRGPGIPEVYTGTVKVYIGGILATIISSNATTIVVQIPPGIGANNLVVLDINEPTPFWITVPELIIVYPGPTVTQAYPSEELKPGMTITVYGANFGADTANNVVITKIGGVACSQVKVLSDEKLTCTIRSGSGANQLVVVTVAGQSSMDVVTVDFAAPKTAGLSCVPPNGAQDYWSPEYCNCFSGYAPANPELSTECDVRAICPGKKWDVSSVAGWRPERPIVTFAHDTLYIRQKSPIVDKRRDTTIQLAIPNLPTPPYHPTKRYYIITYPPAGTLSEQTCWYPGPIWTKSVNELDCLDEFTAQMPWSQHAMCAFVQDQMASTVSKIIYKSELITTQRDAYKKNGVTSYRTIQTSYLLQVSFTRQLKVLTTTSVNVVLFDPDISVEVVGDSVYDIASKNTLMTIETTLNWPYMIPNNAVLPGVFTSTATPPVTGVTASATYTSQRGGISCDASQDSQCTQAWTVTIETNGKCNIQGQFVFNTTTLLCRDLTDSTTCPTPTFKFFTINMGKTDLCDPDEDLDATANLEYTLTPYFDKDLTQEQNLFEVGDAIFFKFHLVDPQGTIDQATFNSIQVMSGSETQEIYGVTAPGDYPTDPATTSDANVFMHVISEQRKFNNTPVAPGTPIDLTFGFKLMRNHLPTILTFTQADMSIPVTIHVTVDIWYHGNQKRSLSALSGSSTAAANEIINIIPPDNEMELAEAAEAMKAEEPSEFSLFAVGSASSVQLGNFVILTITLIFIAQLI